MLCEEDISGMGWCILAQKCATKRKSPASQAEYGRESLAVKFVIEFVIRLALFDFFHGNFDITFLTVMWFLIYAVSLQCLNSTS